MDLIEFPEMTVIYAKDQPQFRPLPAHQRMDRTGTITCCWYLTWRERLQLLFTGRIWHSVLTFREPLQPQRLSVDKPHMPARQGVESC